MAWLGIFFDHFATDGGPKDPDMFEGLSPPRVYPYAHGFVESEMKRLAVSKDPGYTRVNGEEFSIFYSIDHDGGQTGVDQQGCRILQWLFENFDQNGKNKIAARFSEIPIVIHAVSPQRAAALGNALTLLRFLGAAEDQAIAKMMIYGWNPGRGNPQLAARDYEKRVLEFLHGDIFYPEDVSLFDILSRRDLKEHRALAPCCESQIGFIGPLLEWIDECWPETPEEAKDLEQKLRNSLGDEAVYLRKDRMNRRVDSAIAAASRVPY